MSLAVATSTSYLQTLAKDEAIAFVASLQKVKDHLSQELQWMSEQAQQKTAQLQSLETLLSEAVALGLITAQTDSTPELTHASAAESATETDSLASSEAPEPGAMTIAPLPALKRGGVR